MEKVKQLDDLKKQVEETTTAMVTNHIQIALNIMWNKFYEDYKKEWELYSPQKKIEVVDRQLKQMRESIINEITEENGNNI